MRDIFTMVGIPELSVISQFLLLTIIFLAALMFGWIADLLLGENAFGVSFNTGFILIGAFCGAWLWHRYGFATRLDAEAVRAGIAAGSGLLLLLALIVVRP